MPDIVSPSEALQETIMYSAFTKAKAAYDEAISQVRNHDEDNNNIGISNDNDNGEENYIGDDSVNNKNLLH